LPIGKIKPGAGYWPVPAIITDMFKVSMYTYLFPREGVWIRI